MLFLKMPSGTVTASRPRKVTLIGTDIGGMLDLKKTGTELETVWPASQGSIPSVNGPTGGKLGARPSPVVAERMICPAEDTSSLQDSAERQVRTLARPSYVAPEVIASAAVRVDCPGAVTWYVR
jgi:hypothetical protein